jgi:SAM-dependent methyltransferase
MKSKDDLFERLIHEADVLCTGWHDFAYISKTSRMASAPLPWSYASIVKMHMTDVDTMLDMGTGDGGFLSKLVPLPEKTYATEAYKPMIPVAKKTLQKIGVTIVEIQDDNALPFADYYFDLVINRHESYGAAELARILKRGSCFITQQVGGNNDAELNRLLGVDVDHQYEHWALEYAVEELEKAGFVIEQGEETRYPTYVYDVGAVVCYLKAISWQVQDFTIDKYKDRLYAVHRQICENGRMEITSERFLVKARNQGI